jgi:hypothetical protein
MLLHSGADVALRNNQGMSVLAQTVCAGHTHIVAELVKHPLVVPRMQDATGRTALHWACALSMLDSAQILIAIDIESAFVDAHSGENPFQIAIGADCLEIVQAMVLAMSEPKLKLLLEGNDPLDRSPSELATYCGAARVLPYLLGLPQYQSVRQHEKTAVAASVAKEGGSSASSSAGNSPVWSPGSSTTDDFADLDAVLGISSDSDSNQSKRKRPLSGGSIGDSSDSAGGGGVAATGADASKPLQTLDEVRYSRSVTGFCNRGLLLRFTMLFRLKPGHACDPIAHRSGATPPLVMRTTQYHTVRAPHPL